MADGDPVQKVVVYTNEDGDSVVYSTAYTRRQLKYYLSRCLKEHGVSSRPRHRDAGPVPPTSSTQ